MTINDLDVYNAIVRAKFWTGSSPEYSETKDVGYYITQDGFYIKLIEKYNAADDTWKREYDYYREGQQGWTGTSYLIFRVSKGGEERFYKKEGTCSSYGYDAWDGTFRRVYATPKTVEVWEYNEAD